MALPGFFRGTIYEVLSLMTPVKDSAGYVAIERVSGRRRD
jgi:hypothetical protein